MIFDQRSTINDQRSTINDQRSTILLFALLLLLKQQHLDEVGLEAHQEVLSVVLGQLEAVGEHLVGGVEDNPALLPDRFERTISSAPADLLEVLDRK